MMMRIRAGLPTKRLSTCAMTAGLVIGTGILSNAPAHAATSAYVAVNGTHLTVNGQPWYANGFNAYWAMSSSDVGSQYNSCGGKFSDADVDALFTQMAAANVTVIRTWFFQAYAEDAGTGQVLSTGAWALFDRILADAASRGMRVIATLANEDDTCDTTWAYSSENLSDTWKGLEWYTRGFATDTSGGKSMTYEKWVQTVVAHYAANPTIAFWQLLNEAQVVSPSGPEGGCDGTEQEDAAALLGFASAMTAEVHALDQNHLVNFGADTSAGPFCGVDTSTDLEAVNAPMPLCEIHNYDNFVESSYRNPCPEKPFFIGERGFSSWTTDPTQVQADCSAAFASGSSGFLVWQANDGDLATSPIWQALSTCYSVS